MDKISELVAEEIKLSANKISLEVCKTRKEDQLVPPTARSKCFGAFQIMK